MLIMAGAMAGVSMAAIPAGYYDEAVGKSGRSLQTTLADIIDHKDPGYDALWNIYKTTDRRADGKVWDMYSNASNFTFGSDQCGNYGGEGDCYNREHSIPKSWRGGSKYSDAHIVVPTDGYVNNRRGNEPFGEVGSSTYTSKNNFSKLGSCITSGYSGTVFEPNDEYKGDFARIYFYAATRYYDECGNWSGTGFSGSFPYLDEWVRKMMLRWHELDPVSEKEIDRNDAVYATSQGNRNPFVDYPELVDLIFGDNTSTPFNPGGSSDTPAATLITPVDGTSINMGTILLSDEEAVASKVISIEGENFTQPLTISLTGSSFFTVSHSTLSIANIVAGTDVTVTYQPRSSGTHTATMTLSGGGLRKSVNVSLSGTAVEGFAALDAAIVKDVAFQARWTRHSQANDYELAVWSISYSGDVERTIFDANFSQLPAGWSTSGYTSNENNSLRLASGNNDGIAKSPAVDLSSGGTLTVTCEPYKTSDNSALYVLVDGKEVAVIDCSAAAVTESVTLEAATANSTISLMAKKSHRVYLKSAKLTTGGAGNAMLEGYPRRVGDVLSYDVENLAASEIYYYSVTAYNGNTKLATSNEVMVTTCVTDVKEIEADFDDMFVYAYDGTIVLDDAPFNARVNCYSLDGVLCASRTIHDVREVIDMRHKGVYIVQVVTDAACYATRVAVY